MSVLIKGMEMPTDKELSSTVIVYADSSVWDRYEEVLIGKAISVPPHGRLIDADAVQETVLKLIEDGWDITRGDYKQMCNILFECPTIIEADGKE